MKKAFTLIEVNLAMLIMAGGILSVVGLYAFGFRENAQSREDVASAAVAERVMSPLMMALTYTNNVWSSFKNEWTYPSEGWKSYLSGGNYLVSSDPSAQARAAFSGAMGKCRISYSAPSVSDTGMTYALVVHHEENAGTISIALRAVADGQVSQLMSQPIYYTEVAFQGVEQ